MSKHIQTGSSRIVPLTFARYSRPHAKHPERNNDALLTDIPRGLAGVFDGVGSSGQEAARMAARVIRRRWRTIQPDPTRALYETFDVSEILRQMLTEAHQCIQHEGERRKKANSDAATSDTTAVVALFCKKSNNTGYTMTYAHVGDSRAYFLHGQGEMQRLTRDDGYLSRQLRKGNITEEDALRIDQATQPDQLNETEREFFEKRNGITQSLEKFKHIHIATQDIMPGDRVLLCSDGVHDNLTDNEIAEVLRHTARTTVARCLVERASKYSQNDQTAFIRAKNDDMSAIIITCNALPD